MAVAWMLAGAQLAGCSLLPFGGERAALPDAVVALIGDPEDAELGWPRRVDLDDCYELIVADPATWSIGPAGGTVVTDPETGEVGVISNDETLDAPRGSHPCHDDEGGAARWAERLGLTDAGAPPTP